MRHRSFGGAFIVLAVGVGFTDACTPEFTSCYATRSCPDTGGEAGAGAGDANSSATDSGGAGASDQGGSTSDGGPGGGGTTSTGMGGKGSTAATGGSTAAGGTKSTGSGGSELGGAGAQEETGAGGMPECPAGYTWDAKDGCVDINECTTNNGGCSTFANCTNTPGSNTCACKANYSGDGVNCVCAHAPATPTLLAPSRGAYTGSLKASPARKTLRPTFVFTSATSSCGAVTYDLQLDNSCPPGNLGSCEFSSPEVNVKGLTSTTYTPTTDLPVSTTAPVGAFYGWRVRACDPTSVCSTWSSVASLHVGRLREDVNGDGYGDMIIMNSTSNLLVYYGGAAPDFTKVSATPAVATSSNNVGAAFIGDVDGDGYGDLGVMQDYTATQGYAPAIVFGGSNLAARSPLVLSKSAAGCRWLQRSARHGHHCEHLSRRSQRAVCRDRLPDGTRRERVHGRRLFGS